MTFSLLALTFATPWIAWSGLGLATVPILIHLLNRRRFRLVEWAAMRFLLDSQRRNRRRLRFEELLLLALRCLLILLIALAVARPRLASAPVLPGTRGAVDHVFVLDDSYSMGLRRGSSTVFQAAADDLAARLLELHADDQVAIYRTSDRGRPWRALDHAGPPEVLETLAQSVRELSVSDTAAGLAETLSAVRKDLADSTHARRVYLVSDFRRTDFADPAGRLLRPPLADLLGGGAELRFIDHGPEVAGNLTIESVALSGPHALVNDDARLVVTVRNHGSQGVSDVRLRITCGAVELVGTLADVPPGQAVTLETAMRFPAPGPAVVKVELPADPLAADNTAWYVANVRDALSVLLVDGEMDAASAQRSETFYLLAAMNPAGDGRFGIRPEVRSVEHIDTAEFENYDLVVLANVSTLPDLDESGSPETSVVARLRRYVREGGGLLIFTGSKLNIDWYNRVLYEQGAGLSPLRLKAPVGDPSRRERYVSFRGADVANLPMLRIFQGEANVFANLVRFYAYHPAEPAPAGLELPEGVSPAQVLLRFTDEAGSPAMVQRAYHQGRVLMVCSSADADWNDWGKAITITFVPVVYDTVFHLARRREGQHTDRVGAPVSYLLPYSAGDVRVSMKTPAFPVEEIVELPLTAAGGHRQARYEFAPAESAYPGRAGVYTVRMDMEAPGATAVETPFARNVDPAEGDLAKAGRAELDAVVGGGQYLYEDFTAGPAATAAPPVREYWRWLLVAVLAILALEVFLAQRFGHYSVRTEGAAR